MSKPMYCPVEGFGWYLACSDGYLINCDTGYVLKGNKKKNGYREVILKDEFGKPRYLLLHRIIAQCFCEGETDGAEVKHIDGDKSNNAADNLEWVSHAKNLKHAYETGLREDDVSPRKVAAIPIGGDEMLIFRSIYSAAKSLNISQGNICMCCQGKRPYASGYRWFYLDDQKEGEANE